MAAVTDWVRSMVGLGEQIKTAAGSILPRTSQDKTPPYGTICQTDDSSPSFVLDRDYDTDRERSTLL